MQTLNPTSVPFQAIQTELVSLRMAYEELEQRLQETSKIPVETTPPFAGAAALRQYNTAQQSRKETEVQASLRQLVFKGPSARDPSTVPWAQGKAPAEQNRGGPPSGEGGEGGGGIGRYKESPEAETGAFKGRLRRLARNGK
jgi:hypothetical protein